MLTPEQLAHCADDIINLYSQLEEEIVRDIARRIAKTRTMTDTGIWQAQHMLSLVLCTLMCCQVLQNTATGQNQS